MFEEFYEMYEPEEQEVVALINRCIGGGYNWKGSSVTPARSAPKRNGWNGRSPTRSVTVTRAGDAFKASRSAA